VGEIDGRLQTAMDAVWFLHASLSTPGPGSSMYVRGDNKRAYLLGAEL
jgi:hypothetical protein